MGLRCELEIFICSILYQDKLCITSSHSSEYIKTVFKVVNHLLASDDFYMQTEMLYWFIVI